MQGINKPLFRFAQSQIESLIDSGDSLLLLGPRQVGKTTLINKLLETKSNTITYPLQNPSVRQNMEVDPGRLIREIETFEKPPIVFIDEIQKVPALFDAIQLLIDNRKAKFILTGSSARKLKRQGVNLLPGRVIYRRLDPMLWSELGLTKESNIKELKIEHKSSISTYTFEDALIFGSLPLLIQASSEIKADLLQSYSHIYLEEEIRAESISRKIGSFARFLELAAHESGKNLNLTKLSFESGVSLPTIKGYYQILEDTLIIERFDPFKKNARKRILSSPRYYYFDIGVRNALARLPLETGIIAAQKGILFEHFVILEILHRIRALNKSYRLYYWRTSGGAEVDCIIDCGNYVIPIEIKSSTSVRPGEIKGLKQFLSDYHSISPIGYVISQASTKQKLANNIIMLPWFMM
ncbi:ATP-binding protein [Candidatus Roizmanbacteria bacterium]|nr:ATP-binding protein [Candidatus Roizmanbacteria bacterium]